MDRGFTFFVVVFVWDDDDDDTDRKWITSLSWDSWQRQSLFCSQ